MVSYNGKPETSSSQEKSVDSSASPQSSLTFDLNQIPDLESLPFVYRNPKKRAKTPFHYWWLPPAESYIQASQRGMRYALLFMHYLHHHPEEAGGWLLGNIVKDMNLDDEGDSRGYWIGFLSYLERLLYHQSNRLDFTKAYQGLKEQETFLAGK